jgi:hypothetical protein
MGTITERSATTNERLTGFGVDTATFFVGTAEGYGQGELGHHCVIGSAPAMTAGLVCSTFMDGYYAVYAGAHALDPTAAAFVEIVADTVTRTHTDIDGSIEWNDPVYTADQARVDREVTVECRDGKIVIAGDPFHGCVDYNVIDVEPGTYTIRLYEARLLDENGQLGEHPYNVCAIIAPVSA